MLDHADFSKAADKVFSALFNLTERVVISTTDSEYDPETGEVLSVLKSFPAQAFVSRYKSSQVDNTTIFTTDLKAVIAKNNLLFKPQKNDSLLLDNKIYSIISIKEDAAKATVTLQIRG